MADLLDGKVGQFSEEKEKFVCGHGLEKKWPGDESSSYVCASGEKEKEQTWV